MHPEAVYPEIRHLPESAIDGYSSRRGFSGEEEIREHISEFHRKEEFLKALKARWSGKEAEIGQKTVQLLDKWEKDLGFSREMISLAADAALEVRKPMAYMDKLLSYWAEKQIRTEADVLRDRREHQERYQNPDKKPEGKSAAEPDTINNFTHLRGASYYGGGRHES